jgi:hypothetical protein
MIIGRIRRSSSSPPLSESETMTTPHVFVVVVVVVAVVVIADALALKEERSNDRRWAQQGGLGPVLPRDCRHRCLPPLFSPPLTNFLIVVSISLPPTSPVHHGGGD